MKPHLKIAMVAVISLFCANAMAQEEKPKATPATRRLCTEADLAGTYILVDFSEKPPGGETEHHKQFPYQYLAFYPDHRFGITSSAQQIMRAHRLNGLLKPKRGPVRQYTLDKTGALELHVGPKIIYNVRCVANIVDEGLYHKGDLTLTGYSRRGQSQFYKVYRHWY